ncbi:hypothetical protein EBU71_02640 [bacterium]|nr:hypothetical protein [Candidatus Elulimicrobium humile]
MNLVDYYFFNSENPIDNGGGLYFWCQKNCNNSEIMFHRFWKDHTLAGFTQIKFLVELSSILGYDLNYYILYDLVITNQVASFIKSQNNESFFSFMTSENGKILVNDCAAQLFCVSRPKLAKLGEFFTLDQLKKFERFEHFMADLANRLQIPINRNFSVEDHVYQMRNWERDFYDYSPWDEFKIYFCKFTDRPTTGSCMIYDVVKDLEIFVRRDDEVQKTKISKIHEFEIPPNLSVFEFWYNGTIFDVLQNFRKFPGGYWEFL